MPIVPLSPLYRYALVLAIVGLCAAFAPSMCAQNATVRGSAIDKQTRLTLAGASISLVPSEEAKQNDLLYAYEGARMSLNMLSGESAKELRYGAVVGRDGNYEIKNIKPGNYVLTARYIGYKKNVRTLRIESDKTLELALELVPDVQGIQSIVVTGVASRTAKEFAEAAVGRVDMQTLTDNVRFQDPLQALVGKVPGLFMQFSNGAMGSGVRINVRSSASLLGGQPVIFIDGVRSTGVDYHTYPSIQFDEVSPLATLTPDDIETIEVLKGPVASSLYGTSGQNGVLLISTKRGKIPPSALLSGADPPPLRVNYRFTGGWQEPSRTFTEDVTLNAANANRILRTVPMALHNLLLQGALGNTVNFAASITQRNEQGILPGNDAAQTTARLNVDVQPVNGFIAKFSASLAKSNFNIPTQNENGGIFSGWIRNTLAGSPFSGKRFFLVDSASIAAIQNGIDITHFMGSLDLSYTPSFLPGLRVRALAGVEEIKSRAIYYEPPGFPYSIDPTAEPSGGFRLIKNFLPSRYNFDANISYSRELIDGLNATFIAGVQGYDKRSLIDFQFASNFTSPGIKAIQTGTAGRGTSELDERFREVGIIARVETNYQQTYFLSGGVRNDYASTIGDRAPTIFYPQGSFAVRLDRIGFLPKEINLLKLRGGYGESGKLPMLTQSSTFWKIFAGPGTTLTGSSGYRLFLETPIGNGTINPERVQELELGIDAEVSDMYGAEITGFYQYSRDAILNSGSPISNGFSTIAENSGRASGWGVEAQIYGRVINTPDVALQLNLVASYADNMIDSVGGQQRFIFERSFFAGPGFLGPSNYIFKGQRRGLFMDRPVIAPRFRTNGYYDWNRGPQIDSVLRPLGSSVPLATGSFSWTLTLFRDFTFYGLVDGGLGRYMFNSTRQQAAAYGSNARFNELATRLGLAHGQAGDIGAVTVDDPDTYIRPVAGVQALQPNTPAYQAAAEEFMRLDTRYGTVANYLEKADWVRIRELSFRWNARNSLATALSLPDALRTLTLGVSARNVFLWTTYSGADVEINAPADIPSRSIVQSSDIWSLMQARTVNFQLEIGF
jgi:TonB-dependent SusC/RagA subfamily outer membrane receptor